MQTNKIHVILNSANLPNEITDSILNNYCKALNEFRKQNWQYCSNEMGQFTEGAIRLVQFVVEGKYKKFSEQLPRFDEKLLSQWAQSNSNVDISFKVIIPRTLYLMYCLRNKRGAIHKNHITPNKIDACALINLAKWVLAEIVRLSSSMSFDETSELVEEIISKEIDIIWEGHNCSRILNNNMPYDKQILCLLYKHNQLTYKELLAATEYSNSTRFKTILKKLHTNRLIEYTKDDICIITPKGQTSIEEYLATQ